MVIPLTTRVKSLYLALLNVHYGFSHAKYYYLKKKERIWEPLLLIIVLSPSVLMLMWLFWSMTETLFVAGLAFAQPHLSLVYGALIVSLVNLFFGFFYVLSAFYFSTDLEMLIPLPMTSWEILAAKLGVVLTGQYVVNAAILLPIWLKYALLAKVGISYFVSALCLFLFLPIIPLVLASIASVVLMHFTSFSVNKDRLIVIGGILLVVLVLGFQIWVQNSVGSGDLEQLLQEILNQTDGLVQLVGKVFPPALWAGQALGYSYTWSGWLNLFYLGAASLLGFVILYVLGEKVFLQGVVAGLEGSKRVSARQRDYKKSVSKPALVTLVGTEIRLFVRDPGFALNGLVSYVFLPVFAILPLFIQNVGNNPFDILVQGQIPNMLLLGGVALYFMVMTGFSMIPATTFSREGKYLWIMRTLPLSVADIIFPRVIAAQVVNTLGCLIGLIPLTLLYNWNPLPIIVGSILGICLAAALSVSLILLDLNRPMLDWVNPIKAVKSNLNAMLGLFGAMFLISILGVLFYFSLRTNTLWLIPLELVLVWAVLIIINKLIYKKFAVQRWLSLEGGTR